MKFKFKIQKYLTDAVEATADVFAGQPNRTAKYTRDLGMRRDRQKTFDDKIYIANVGTFPDDWTVKKLLGKHSSRPYNPTIASCVYLTGMIETWGRGIRKVFDECRKYGCPPPVYEVSAGEPGDIMVRIDAAPDALVDESRETASGAVSGAVNGAVNDGVRISASQIRVAEAIGTNPGINARRIAKRLGMGTSTVDRCVRVLKDLHLIEFRGSPKTGGYYCK